MSRRQKKHGEEENHERWLVSYADFITLLFAFFVVMYATSTNNEEKQKKFEDSVRIELKLGVGGGAGGSGPGAPVTREALLENVVGSSDFFPRRGSPEEVRDYLERQMKKDAGDGKKGVSVRHDSVGARITLSASSFFSSGSAKILRDSFGALDQVAALLKETDRRVLIEGHTDDVPFQNGEFASNWELASLRATAVLRYLVKVHGISPNRLAAISYADQKPLVANDSEENRSKNRRVEILLLGEE